MAGRGRPQKPAALRVLDGTHRDDRHGLEESFLKPSGDPAASVVLSGDALIHWNSVVPKLMAMGIATSSDSEVLTEMCQLWGLVRAAYREAEKSPTERNARTSYLGYVKQWETLAGRFGMTPADRNKIRAEKPAVDSLESKFA